MKVTLQLRFLSGHHQGQSLEFEAPRTLVLGRSSQADVQIYDERISRKHVALRVEESGVVRIKDLGSGNGTFVNRCEVREGQLKTGDRLSIGRTEVEIRVDQAAKTEALPAVPHGQVTEQMRGGQPRPGSGRQAGPSKPCATCGGEVTHAQQAVATRFRGRYVCWNCSPPPQLPAYQLERTLGEGAMGVVYLARHKASNTPVAVKVLKVRGEVTAEDMARFEREVQTSAGLQHPNIVKVIDHGRAPPAFLFYVMEFVPGLSLKQWIDKHGPLPLLSALKVSVQVADALNHARERNVVHRDIKPENIIVGGDGAAKLADFGLAKNTQNQGAAGLTRPGDGLGTLPYMPPEQIENALYADHRSDVYSFGATIYHMFTGQAPFKAKTPLAFFKKIRDETPTPIAEFRRDVPQVLLNMVSKALSKAPEDRYQNVSDMSGIMRQFLDANFDSRQTAS